MEFFSKSILSRPIFWLLISLLCLFFGKYYENYYLLLFSGLCCFAAIIISKSLSIRIVIIILYLSSTYYFLDSYSTKNILENPEIQQKVICGVVRSYDEDKKVVKLLFSELNGKRVLGDILIANFTQKVEPFTSLCVMTNSSIAKYSYFQLRVKIESNNSIENSSNIISVLISDISTTLNSSINNYLASRAGLFKAIVFGIQEDLEKDQKAEFRDLGLSHVLVASGANIILIVNAINIAISRLKIKRTKLVQFIVVSIYLLVIGIEGSIGRAFLFFLTNLFVQYQGREIGYLQKILFAVVLFSIIFPELLISFSFILSIGAVLCLKLSSDFSDFVSIKTKLIRFILQSTFIVVIVGLITAYFFKNYNLTGIFSNLVVLPIIEIIVVFGFWSGLIFVIGNIVNNSVLDYLIHMLAKLITLMLDLIIYINDMLTLMLQDTFMFKFGINKSELIFIIISIAVFWIYLNFINFNRKLENKNFHNEDEVEIVV